MNMAIMEQYQISKKQNDYGNLSLTQAEDLMKTTENLRITKQKFSEIDRPILYEPVNNTNSSATALVFGQMGSGKSTSLNSIILQMKLDERGGSFFSSMFHRMYQFSLAVSDQLYNLVGYEVDLISEFDLDQNDMFKAMISNKAVTKKPEKKQIGNLTLIDSPGFNDPERDNLDNLVQITDFLNKNAVHNKSGLNG